MSTFYQKLAERDNVLIVIEDTEGAKFGAFTVESWHAGESGFYGCGDGMFLFKLYQMEAKEGKPPETDSLEAFEATFLNNKYMASTSNSLMIGSSDKGVSSLFVGDGFRSGYTSSESETFHHPVLSSAHDFKIAHFEAWGFDFI